MLHLFHGLVTLRGERFEKKKSALKQRKQYFRMNASRFVE
jgi:hypothetical protein